MAAVSTAPENACSESQVGSQNIATNCEVTKHGTKMFSNRIIIKKYVVCIISVLIFKKKSKNIMHMRTSFKRGWGFC